MQLPSLLMTIAAAQVLLGSAAAAPGAVVMSPRVPEGADTITITAVVPPLPAGHGYKIVPVEMAAPVNTGLQKRSQGCDGACQWCGGCGDVGICCIDICCAASDVSQAECAQWGFSWSTNC